MGTVSLGWLAVIDSAFDLTRPGKANEGDELGWLASPQGATHDFLDPTGLVGHGFAGRGCDRIGFRPNTTKQSQRGR
jgi:hypothetical protein